MFSAKEELLFSLSSVDQTSDHSSASADIIVECLSSTLPIAGSDVLQHC